MKKELLLLLFWLVGVHLHRAIEMRKHSWNRSSEIHRTGSLVIEKQYRL